MVTFPDGVALKIKRAKEHINDLNALIDAYLAERPMKLFITQDRKTAEKSGIVKIERPIPVNVAVILGDALHNLRTALDHLAYHLIGRLTSSEQGIHFPFAWKSDPVSVRQTIRSRQMHLAGEHVADAVQDLNFYFGGNSLLSGLHILDIADKHKLLIAIGRVAPISADNIKQMIPEASISGPGILAFVGESEVAFTVKLAGNRAQRRARESFQREAEIQPTFLICFGPETPFNGQALIPKLEEITAEVERAVTHVLSATPKTLAP